MKRKKNLIIILIVVSIILIIGIVGVMAFFITRNNNERENNNIIEDNENVDVVDDSELYDAPPPTDEEIDSNEENIDDSEFEEENIQTDGNDLTKLIFNSKFVSYRRKINGDEFNELIQKIKDSNEANPDHRVTLTSNNLKDLNAIMSTDKYEVEFSYDEQGFVNNIIVDKIDDSESLEDISTGINNGNNISSDENEV